MCLGPLQWGLETVPVGGGGLGLPGGAKASSSMVPDTLT